MRLSIGIKFDADSRTFVAFCPAFDVMSAGLTVREAREALKSAVEWIAYSDLHEKRLTKKGYEILHLEI